MQAIPSAIGAIRPADGFDHGQLLQNRKAGRPKRRHAYPGGRAIWTIEMPHIWRYYSRPIVRHVRVGYQTAVSLHGRGDVEGDVPGIEHLVRIIEAVRVRLAIGVCVAWAVGV